MIHTRDCVLRILHAPGAPDSHPEVLAAPRRAARVGQHHDVTMGGKELCIEIESIIELGPRAAVAQEQRGIALPRSKTRRLVDEALDLGTVRARKAHAFDFSEFDAGQDKASLCRVSLRRPLASTAKRLPGVSDSLTSATISPSAAIA